MGCATSKAEKGSVDVYRPHPASLSVFDINSIKEPWLVHDHAPPDDDQQKAEQAVVPPAILDNLDDTVAPRSWDEVSKALETHLKPTTTAVKDSQPPAEKQKTASVNKPPRRKSFSFHTLEELDARVNNKQLNRVSTDFKKSESGSKTNTKSAESTVVVNSVKLKENIFILRDRQAKEKDTKPLKWDPLQDFPEKEPPGGGSTVVVYTTSVRGVRRTHEDCTRVKSILEGYRVVYDERDVSLHGEFLMELKELVGESLVPRVFVKGRYIGGVEEVNELNEKGRLGRILSWARVERLGDGRQPCEACGGARFVPCLECGGSCKVFNDKVWRRCGKCNENGLLRCPLCL